jgi:hypothetical protein
MPISRNNSNFLFCPQLSSLFPPRRQVAPPAQKFVDERPLLYICPRCNRDYESNAGWTCVALVSQCRFLGLYCIAVFELVCMSKVCPDTKTGCWRIPRQTQICERSQKTGFGFLRGRLHVRFCKNHRTIWCQRYLANEFEIDFS